MPKVKCLYCGQQLERDSDECEKVTSRRYAHKSCIQGLSTEEKQKEEDKRKLTDYIKDLFGEKANWALITKQIKQYETEYGYSYSGMLKALTYFYNVKKNDVSKANGNLGIIPFTYKDAYNYYYEMWLRQEQNKNAAGVAIHTVEVTIRPPSARKKLKLFDLGDD